MRGQAFQATGRRKNAIARVRLIPGSGEFRVNNRTVDEYFRRATLRMVVEQPLQLTENLGNYDVVALVDGGGLAGQAGAVRLGIARALLKVDEDYRSRLRGAGFLTRDPRMIERKKYGLAGARKRFQFSKR